MFFLFFSRVPLDSNELQDYILNEPQRLSKVLKRSFIIAVHSNFFYIFIKNSLLPSSGYVCRVSKLEFYFKSCIVPDGNLSLNRVVKEVFLLFFLLMLT